MLSKSSAKAFFVVGTAICSGAFVLLTLDTVKRVPQQTNQQNMTESVIRGKNLWDHNNCMGCHTLLGEGAYYAPELTKVFERRGAQFIHAMLTDPEAMFPGQRKMVKYDFSEQEKQDLIAFFKWIGEADLNGFPAKPDLGQNTSISSSASNISIPNTFKQNCEACHSIAGKGGTIGPALDGIASRRDNQFITTQIKDPKSNKPDSAMPQLALSEADVNELVSFLSSLK